MRYQCSRALLRVTDADPTVVIARDKVIEVVKREIAGAKSALEKVTSEDSVRTHIENAGAKLLFLPPYSPDFSPIEPAWSKVKALLRRSAGRTYDALLDAVVCALRAITREDARGWFRLCGYGPCV